MSDPENKVAEEADIMEEVEDGDDAQKADMTEEGTVTSSAELASQLMKSPQVLAALQERLGSMVGNPSGYIQSLPKPVKRRLKALKKLQFDTTKIESEFFKEVHELECKYASKYAPLLERRRNIVSAETEPTDSDCDWPSEDEKEEELSVSKEDMKNKAKIEEKTENKVEKEEETEENTKGVPQFWLTIFKNVDMLSEMVQDHDEPILQHIQDIQVKFSPLESMGFTLEFHFEPNEYFSNTMLTKQYIMKSDPDESDPFSYEGPEIVKCKGCTIDWKKGKNVTVKTIKKKQKHKGTGKARVVTKTVQNDSFFNFFNPPQALEDDGEVDDDVEALLAADFEIGHFIRERIVPRAVLYFTGEALENDDDFDEEENEEEEGGEEEYDEDHDPDFNPGQAKPAECKQQ